MLSYISQPVDAISPHSLQSPNAIRAGWAGLVTSPKKTSLDENVPPHPVRANQHQFKSSAAAASKHRRMGTWSHASDQLTGWYSKMPIYFEFLMVISKATVKSTHWQMTRLTSV